MNRSVFASTLLASLPIHAAPAGQEIYGYDNNIPLSDSSSAITAFTAGSRPAPPARTIHSLQLSQITDLPGPWPHPQQELTESPAWLSWTQVEGAASYRVTIRDGHDLEQVHGDLTANRLDLPAPLPFGKIYTWQVTSVLDSGATVDGPAYTFSILFPQGPPVTGVYGESVALGARNLIVGSESSLFIGRGVTLSSFDPVTGANSPLEALTFPGNATSHSFGTPVALDGSTAYVGARGWDGEDLINAGALFRYEAAAPDRARPHRFHSPAPIAGQSFGSAFAADGDLLLVRSPVADSPFFRGSVAAFLTQPATTFVQELRPSDSVIDDFFGTAIAMEGNTAVISAPGEGRGSDPARLPCAYVFTRSTATGLWSEVQKLALPNAAARNQAGSAMALDGGLLAINNLSRGEVLVFTRNPDGTFVHHSTLARASVPGATNRFGASVALHGDLLLVGDTEVPAPAFGYGGVVFTFRRVGSEWIQDPVIQPEGLVRGFGWSLAVRDGWLLAGATNTPAWLFRLDPQPNLAPEIEPLPYQAVSNRDFEAIVTASDRDDSEGLSLSALQLPAWLTFTDLGNGLGRLRGMPAAEAGSTFDLQIEATDARGASTRRATRLIILDPADVPSVSVSPTAGDLKEGQELTLRATATGTGPIAWQWQRDGTDIPGATAASLHLPEILTDDAGTYTAIARNAVGAAVSPPVAITVAPADRFAGPWRTSGNSPRRSGFHPARLGSHRFQPVWEAQVHEFYPLSRAVVAGGEVFVSEMLAHGGHPSLHSLRLTDGSSRWNRDFGSTESSPPLSWHGGRLYYQQMVSSSENLLWSLDAADAATVWSAPFMSQFASYEAPAVTDDGVWIKGGNQSGIHGFGLDGAPRFQIDLPFHWAPAVSDGRLFSWADGVLREHDPDLGITLWSLDSGSTLQGMNLPAIRGDRAAAISKDGLICFDLSNRSIHWQVPGAFLDSPAIAGSQVYAIRGNDVESYDLDDGTPGPVFEAGAPVTSEQPLLLHDHLIVSTEADVIVFDRASGARLQTIPGGGLPSYADGHLIVAGEDGTLRAYFANAAPELSPGAPNGIAGGAEAADISLGLSPFFTDPDPGDSLTWEISDVGNPDLFRSLEIDAATGWLTVSYNPWVHGQSGVLFTVTDTAGNSAQWPVVFSVPPHAAPGLQIAETLSLNRQTGLYEHSITVTNAAAREIAGFDLAIAGLPAGVTLNNASGRENGTWIIHHRQPLAAGSSVTLLLEYYTPVRGTVIDPDVSVKLVSLPEVHPPAAEGGLAVDRCVRLEDKSVLIEFTTVPGSLYEVQYSDNVSDWKISPVQIRAAGNRVQWIDRGPPRTDIPPSGKNSRFYRVREIAHP